MLLFRRSITNQHPYKKMKKKLRRKIEIESGNIPAIECLEESFHILRMNIVSLMPVYCIGTVPFVLGMIYFINDMCQRSDAVRIIPRYALYITVLFLWKNLFQALFCSRVMDKLTSNPPVRRTYKDYARILLYQGIIQPYSLFANAVAAVLFFPLPWSIAFFTNVSFFAASEKKGFIETIRISFRNALVYPYQNNLIFYMLLIFAFMAALNTALLIFLIPWVLKTFMGIETLFSKANGADILLNLIFNSTFWSVVIGVTYMAIDPLLKTAYTVRIFYAESIFKGFDIISSLHRLKTIAAKNVNKISLIVIMFLLLFTSSTQLQAETAGGGSSEQLDNAIQKVLERREYSWRLPPEPFDSDEINAIALFFDETFKTISEWIDDIMEFLSQFFSGPEKRSSSGFANFISWISANSLALLIICFVLILLSIAFILLRRKRDILKTKAEETKNEVKTPDLTDENLTADSLKNSEWLEVASELLAKGELKLALRAIFLASIATLADKNALTIAKYKTNFDYLRELQRRCHGNTAYITAFGKNLNTFEAVWYGDYDVTKSIIATFRKNFDILNEHDA